MMYSEFAKATGCRDNAHNHKVFENLEIMYMNSDMTKEEIYEYGRKLVDNSKSPEQIEFEEKVNAEISLCLRDIEYWKMQIEHNKAILESETNVVWSKNLKNSIKGYQQEIKNLRARIKALRWVLE